MAPSMDPIKKWYLEKQQAQEDSLLHYKKPKAPYFRASELGRCKRDIYYRLAGYLPKAFGARGCDYSRDGDLHHDAMRFWMKDEVGLELAGLRFNRDGTIQETINHFVTVPSPDGAIKFAMRLDGKVKLGRKWHVLECKSLGWGKLKAMRQLWERTLSTTAVVGWLRENRRDIIYQVHACMFAEKLRSTYMVPKDRSECAVGLHSYKDPEGIVGGVLIEWDEGIWKQILMRCQTILRALKAGVPPKPEFLASSKDCKNCAHLHLCHGAEKRRKRGLEPAELHPTLGEVVHADQL